MPADESVRLYELVLGNGRPASPFAWRIRYALAHKAIPFQSVLLGFTDIPTAFAGRFKTVPVLAHGEFMLNESWDIAVYLDRAFPQHAPLFATPAELALARMVDAWLSTEVMRRLFRIYALDIYNAARPADQAYFRSSREARFPGETLESLTADREQRLPDARAALAPLRVRLAKDPYIGGAQPHYADYVVAGAFQWLCSVATLPLLENEDQVLREWWQRCQDLFGGAGRVGNERPLFA